MSGKLKRYIHSLNFRVSRSPNWVTFLVALLIMLAAQPATAALSYTHDPNGNVTAIDWDGDLRGYDYDALDRLVNEVIGLDPVFEYQYDANGNRTASETGNDGNPVPYDYAPGSNRLNGHDGHPYTRDAAGNTLSDPQGRSYEYNDAGRLARVLVDGSEVASYTYNAAGQRTRKVTPTQTVFYHYDLDGHLLAETDATGATLREYVWQDRQPVAMVAQGGGGETIAYLHTDHLNTPRRATDAGGVVVWEWKSDAFGATQPVEDRDGDGVATTVKLRFPGQYYDGETGLVYNYFRDYDPATGRYLESDPIGLDGGSNTYTYVGGNPLAYTDPTGECPWCIAYALFEIGLAIYDAYDTADTVLDSCSTGQEKAIAGGLFVIGALLPGGGYRKFDDVFDVTRGGDAFIGIKEASEVLQSTGFPRSARVQILQSFEAGTVSVGQASANQFGLRFFGGKAEASGGFLFDTFPASRQSLALRPEFNAMTGLRQFQIRPGATVISGRAASQGVGFEGGQIQHFILDPSQDLLP